MAASPGRPREVGNEEWMTVREAADALGVEPQAIYQRIGRKTIEFNQYLDENEQVRYRIARSAVVPATQKDTGEIMLQGQQLLDTAGRLLDAALTLSMDLQAVRREVEGNRELLASEISKQRAEVLAEMREQSKAREEQFERIMRLADELLKETKRQSRPWWKRLFSID